MENFSYPSVNIENFIDSESQSDTTTMFISSKSFRIYEQLSYIALVT